MSLKGKICLFSLVFPLFTQNLFAYTGSENIYTNGNDEILRLFDPSSGDQFSSEFAVGDFNGDTVDDLAISSPYASSYLKEWNGKVSIYFGGGENLNQSDLVLYGKSSGDLSGMALIAGDINMDGIDDLIIGSHNALIDDERKGKVSIFYGKTEFGSSSFVLGESPDISEIYGQIAGSDFGLALNISDVNGDNVNEILVGAPSEKIGEMSLSGALYVFNTNKGPFKDNFTKISGLSQGGKFASEISSGDIDGDGLNEIFISAYREDFEENFEVGKVYVYKVNGLYPGVTEQVNFSFSGKKDYGWFGFQTEIFDLNQDGVDDLVVSSFPFAAKERIGEVMVFFGEKDLFLKTEKEPDFVFNKAISGNILGASLFVSDLFTGGAPQIIAGAPGIGYPKSDDSGIAFVIGLDGKYMTIYGENPDDWFGYRVSSLDFDKDGFKDIVVGAKYADFDAGVNSGKAFVLFGSENGFITKLHESADELKGDEVSRGEMVYLLTNEFDLKEKNSALISSCMDYKEFCFFDFMARSNFSGISLEPDLILYPDNLPGNKYYEEINVATILGIVNGFIEEDGSPFKPEAKLSRIHALKALLGAADLMDFKYKFELENSFGSLEALLNQSSYFKDVSAKISHMWWYPRYINFAYEAGIVEKTENFRPDDLITLSELNDMIEKTKEYLTLKNAGTQTES